MTPDQVLSLMESIADEAEGSDSEVRQFTERDLIIAQSFGVIACARFIGGDALVERILREYPDVVANGL